MTGSAGTAGAAMIEGSGQPGNGGVAHATFQGGEYVTRALALCGIAIMAGGAGTTGAAMIEICGYPGIGGMAHAALQGSEHVTAAFA